MSCYAVTVLTPRVFSPDDVERIAAFIHNFAGEVSNGDFRVSGQPFCYEFVELDEDERRIIVQGWSPRGALLLVTYCGSKINHIVLGILSSRLARMFDGWIALGGSLADVTCNPSVLTYDGTLGRLQTDHGPDVVSPGLMDYWLGHDDFRLI